MTGGNSLCYFHTDLNHIRQNNTLLWGSRKKQHLKTLKDLDLVISLTSKCSFFHPFGYFSLNISVPNNDNNKASGYTTKNRFFHKCTKHNANGSIISPAALCVTAAWTRCALCAADAGSRAAVLRHRLGLWHLLLWSCTTWRGRWIKRMLKLTETHRKRQCSDPWHLENNESH